MTKANEMEDSTLYIYPPTLTVKLKRAQNPRGQFVPREVAHPHVIWSRFDSEPLNFKRFTQKPDHPFHPSAFEEQKKDIKKDI
ncbi:Hypothetical protein NTJ_05249 [Nesidiocoris tenuis]|uniref:Uncharacterized protein n=1 Tax=Nesidiocoris tenuis TaxID=355587 RepID=A0ABN7AKF9_9HEMI|nr:Hypothetical protein NTJ_05249 [Nesidiocoris tenuis]